MIRFSDKACRKRLSVSDLSFRRDHARNIHRSLRFSAGDAGPSWAKVIVP